ncbi:MAG: phospholipase D-like domain-containing protein [Candidatus Heimdallarchaeaceae archaeon]
MTILYDYSSLQFSVLNMFKDILLSDEVDFFIIASPWITDFSFDESVLSRSNEFRRIFPKELSLSKLLNQVGDYFYTKHVVPSIIVHSFNIKLENNLKKVLNIVSRYQEEQHIDLKYQILNEAFFEKSVYNRIWLGNTYTVQKNLDNSRREKNNFISFVSQLGNSKQQLIYNEITLIFLKRLLNLGFEIRINSNFHAKIFVTSLGALAGSSNWTQGGFTFNDEINVYFANIEEYENQYLGLKNRVKNLFENSNPIDENTINCLILIQKALGELYENILAEITGNW